MDNNTGQVLCWAMVIFLLLFIGSCMSYNECKQMDYNYKMKQLELQMQIYKD